MSAQQGIPAQVYRFFSLDHYLTLLSEKDCSREPAEEFLFLLLEPLYALVVFVTHLKDPVRQKESLRPLVNQKLAANSQRQQIHLAAVKLEDVSYTALKLQRP